MTATPLPTVKYRPIIHTKDLETLYYSEDLGQGIPLNMVEIPAGSFMMGSPEDEIDRLEREGPQHEVRVSRFFIGMTTITQAQWRVVATEFPQIDQTLNPDPSHFKGDDRPVEQVSWFDAVEFCQRVSQKTRREYRLPTEAEWEYACRAGTTTPFHFGETITTDLANYRGTDYRSTDDPALKWSGSYGRGPEGEYREKTTPVGSFPPNEFGLYDMHGNVWEWCLDHWHENYQGAPTDGSAWITDADNSPRLLRGGSWLYVPRFCRSASRNGSGPDLRYYDLGFRVACSAARTL